MNKKGILLSKTLVIGVFILFVGAVIVPCISSDILINNYQGILFEDDFNDNTKDINKWTELYNDGDWWERNHQAEFRCYETIPTSYEGIESIGIPVTIKKVPLRIECIMDTFIDNYPNPYYQDVGKIYLRVVDADDPDNHYIVVFYQRYYDDIRVVDSSGTNIILGLTNEFRSKVTITINKDGYTVDVGPYTSGFIPETIFSEEFTVKLRLYIFLNGDYPNYWWIGGFDDVIITGKKSNPRNREIILSSFLVRYLERLPLLERLLTLIRLI